MFIIINHNLTYGNHALIIILEEGIKHIAKEKDYENQRKKSA